MRTVIFLTLVSVGSALNVQFPSLAEIAQKQLHERMMELKKIKTELEKPKHKHTATSEAGSSLPSFYHSTATVSKELKELVKTCEGLSMETRTDSGVTIEVLKYKPAVPTTYRAAIFAGEHSREFIGVETALNIVKEICAAPKGKPVLTPMELLIVVNANPDGRRLAEQGEFCRRISAKGVDLNRNWDVNWRGTQPDKDTPPGKKPFSEPETRIMKSLMEEFKPHTIISVQSGNLGMYLPNKLSAQHGEAKKLEKIIADVDDKFCQCPLGIANEEVGYQTSGSSLDYAYSVAGAKVSLAVEIFIEEDETKSLHQRWHMNKGDLLSSFIEGGVSKLAAAGTSEFVRDMMSEQKFESRIQEFGADWCLNHFNPLTEQAYNRTVKDWTSAILESIIKLEKYALDKDA